MNARNPKKSPPTQKSIEMGRRIRTQRELLGFTQAALGAKIGVSENAITQYETGRSSPRRERIPALLDVLGKSIGWLLTGDEPDEEVRAQTEDERSILVEARKLTSEKQRLLLKMMKALKD